MKNVLAILVFALGSLAFAGQACDGKAAQKTANAATPASSCATTAATTGEAQPQPAVLKADSASSCCASKTAAVKVATAPTSGHCSSTEVKAATASSCSAEKVAQTEALPASVKTSVAPASGHCSSSEVKAAVASSCSAEKVAQAEALPASVKASVAPVTASTKCETKAEATAQKACCAANTADVKIAAATQTEDSKN